MWEIAASRVELLGFSVSSTVITTWIAMGGILLGALAIRLFLIPRMKDQPRGLQNVLEIAVESVSKYTDEKSGHLGGKPGCLYLLGSDADDRLCRHRALWRAGTHGGYHHDFRHGSDYLYSHQLLRHQEEGG